MEGTGPTWFRVRNGSKLRAECIPGRPSRHLQIVLGKSGLVQLPFSLDMSTDRLR